jgi:hypothetical protein
MGLDLAERDVESIASILAIGDMSQLGQVDLFGEQQHRQIEDEDALHDGYDENDDEEEFN